MYKQIVRLDRLQATEFITSDETLMNHRKYGDMSLEETRRGLIDPGNQAQKRALTRPVMADQGNAFPLMDGATDVL